MLSMIILSTAYLWLNCNAESSRLLLQTTSTSTSSAPNSCICPAIFSPVCCDGNIEYTSQCKADCDNASNCISGGCSFGCASTSCLKGTECKPKEGGNIGQVECVLIADYCETDSDCSVKNVGNCCGYYPGCVNNEYIVDLDGVKQFCADNDVSSICGFREPNGCSCINNKCHEEYDDTLITPSPTINEKCILLDGYTLIGTLKTCPLINFICSAGFGYWFDSNCGCGCKPNCDELPDGWSLVSDDSNQCKILDFICDQGYEYWSNDCGCGCKKPKHLLRKKTCTRFNNNNNTDCRNGYECIIDPECEDTDNVFSKRRVCAKIDGECGGFVGGQCFVTSEKCAYPCGSTIGKCITYQYE